MPIVTTYDTLGEEGLKHAIDQTRPKAIFVDPHMLNSLTRPLKESDAIRLVVYSSERAVNVAELDQLRSSLGPRVDVISFNDLVELGEGSPHDTHPPKADDVSCIMYTSGSTGPPKGVVLKHKNVVAASK